MFRLLRAAAYAVAASVAGFGAAYAGPSMAWEFDAAPAADYLIHSDATATAGIPAASTGVQQPTSYDPNLTPAVATHAVASEEVVEKPAIKRSLADLVVDHAGGAVADAEQECLAGAIYFESKGEPLEGQLAVAEVILNRVESGRYPKTICGVVKQKGQFSFVRGGRIPAIARNSQAWSRAVAIAHIAAEELADSRAGNALFFHANYVSPRWRKARIASIGNHIFYR